MNVIFPDGNQYNLQSTTRPTYSIDLAIADPKGKWRGPIKIQVDLGANMAACLSRKTAERLGINLKDVPFVDFTQFDNSQIKAQILHLDLRIGEIPGGNAVIFRQVPVAIVSVPEGGSVIGSLILGCFSFSTVGTEITQLKANSKAIQRLMVNDVFEKDFYSQT